MFRVFFIILFVVGFKTAYAQTESPCQNDIRTFCREARTKVEIVRCLDEHRAQITEACRESQDYYQQLNRNVLKNCAFEKGKFCRGVQPKRGEEPLMNCLWSHEPELSPACHSALQAHENAKRNL